MHTHRKNDSNNDDDSNGIEVQRAPRSDSLARRIDASESCAPETTR